MKPGSQEFVARRSSILKGASVVLATVAALIGIAEVRHRITFGHFVGYGVHMDLRSGPPLTPADPFGASREQLITVSNFSFFPISMQGCLVELTGTQLFFPFSAQKLDQRINEWVTDPTARIPRCEATGGTVVPKRLWPLTSYQSVGISVLTPHHWYREGDWFRFVAATRYDVPVESQRTFTSPAFQLRPGSNDVAVSPQ